MSSYNTWKSPETTAFIPLTSYIQFQLHFLKGKATLSKFVINFCVNYHVAGADPGIPERGGGIQRPRKGRSVGEKQKTSGGGGALTPLDPPLGGRRCEWYFLDLMTTKLFTCCKSHPFVASKLKITMSPSC